MITNSKNKAVESPNSEQLEDYHFAGSGEYIPQTVRAKSRQAAEEEWRRTRKPVNAPEAPAAQTDPLPEQP